MGDRNLLVEGGQRGSHGGGGVAVDKHHVRLHLPVHIAQSGKHPGGDIVEVLPLLHDVEVVMGRDAEQPQYLVEHLAVLTGNADKGLEPVGLFLKCFHQRGYLDGFGTGAKDQHDSFFIFHSVRVLFSEVSFF